MARTALCDPFDMALAAQPPCKVPEAQYRVCFISQLMAEEQDLLLWSRLLGALCREVLRRNQRAGAAIHLSLVPRVDLLRVIAENTKVDTLEQMTLWRNYTTCTVATLDLNRRSPHPPRFQDIFLCVCVCVYVYIYEGECTYVLSLSLSLLVPCHFALRLFFFFFFFWLVVL
jgi:hypothetical protein